MNAASVSTSPPQTKSMKLYEACLTLLQVYSKNSSRKRSDSAAEEDQYQDLLLIMELLTNLLSKEFIDFSDTGEGRASQPGGALVAPALKTLVFPLAAGACRRRVQKPGPGNACMQSHSVRSRCGSLRCQHRSTPHDAGPAEGENLCPLQPLLSVCGLHPGSAFQFPSLCNQYYKLITFICEIFPEKIPQLPEDLFKSLMFSLELGMTSYPPPAQPD